MGKSWEYMYAWLNYDMPVRIDFGRRRKPKQMGEARAM